MVAGRVVACKWVKLACQRHLDDLARAKKGWAYYFDEAKANHVCQFIESLPHVKGHWAAELQFIVLQPWQCFILCVIFGWLKVTTRTRRFSLAYVAVPRKNGKSILGGGIGLYMLAADGEFGAEVYSGATSEKQAWEVFRPAKQMMERSPELAEAFGVKVGPQRIYIEANGSRFEAVIGKPGDGASPHCGIVDEYHEHDSDTLLDTFRTGMGARKQPLLLVITTSGDNLAGPCKLLQGDLENVLAGTIDRDEFFGVVYTIDEGKGGDDWTSEEALRKANPNYDVSVFGEFLKTEQRNAVNSARKQSVFKTKHLNVWVGANAAFFNIEQWNRLADPSLKPEEFQGLPCSHGSDLASKIDITACVKVFRKVIDGKYHYFVFGRYYLPENRAMMPEFQHYQGWVHQGFLHTTPGSAIDYDIIERDVVADIQKYRIAEFTYDDWNAEEYSQRIEKQTRATRIDVGQNVRDLSAPMRDLEALIADGRVHHDGNPVLAWAMGNVVARPDTNDNVKPNKSPGRGESKIDPAVALIMAMSRAVIAQGASVYSTRGILFI